MMFFTIGCVFYCVRDWDDQQIDLHVSIHDGFKIQFAGIVSVFLEFNGPSSLDSFTDLVLTLRGSKDRQKVMALFPISTCIYLMYLQSVYQTHELFLLFEGPAKPDNFLIANTFFFDHF